MTGRRGAAGLALLAALAAAGCGTQVVEKAELEREVKRGITESVGQAPKGISCPGDIDAKKGAKTVCVLTAPDNSKVDVNVRVSGVKDDKAQFDIEVDDEVRR